MNNLKTEINYYEINGKYLNSKPTTHFFMEMETLKGADPFVFLRPNKRKKSELTMEGRIIRKNNSSRIILLDNIIENTNTNTKVGFIMDKITPKNNSLEGTYKGIMLLSPVLKMYSGFLNMYSGEEKNLFFARNMPLLVTVYSEICAEINKK